MVTLREGFAGHVRVRVGGELKVRVVGGFGVSLAGLAMPDSQVGSRKARNLLALLALDVGHLPVDHIAGALWGSDPPRDPVANVATLVSRLRATLGPNVIIGDRDGYRLGERVRVDLAEAADLVATAEARIMDATPAAALTAARRALHLLDRGGVLPEQPDAQWTGPAHARHSVLLGRARHATAEAALRVGATGIARDAAAAAVAADPLDETGYRLLMRAHHAAGEPARALRAYQRLRIALATELGVDPALATRNLHTTILQDAPGTAVLAAG